VLAGLLYMTTQNVEATMEQAAKDKVWETHYDGLTIEHSDTWLQLNFTKVGLQSHGAHQLARLQEASDLKHLVLDLEGTVVTDKEVLQLAELMNSPSLERFELDLSGTQVTDLSAMALAGLKDTPHLKQLYLDLADTQITKGILPALELMQDSPSLATVELRVQPDWQGEADAHLGSLAGKVRA